MKSWDLSPPPPSDLGDHDVPLEGEHLKDKRVALLVTGGIAAIKAPFIARALRRQGADVVAFCSKEALRYTTADALEWSTTNPVITKLTPASEHLSDARPMDAYLVAPATYNTINKVALGIADGVLTSTLATAVGLLERGKTRLLIAPTMHGNLHNSILTESMRKLSGLGVRIIPPRESYGKHNIPDNDVLVAEVCAELSTSSLRGRRILVTGGPTAVPIDGVRRITNRFTGRLGIEIANELTLRGADAQLILGDAGTSAPSYVECTRVGSFDEYRDAVLAALDGQEHAAGIFSAAVADYRAETVVEGKIPSGGALKTLSLTPTEKIIDQVHGRFAGLPMVTFKYEENVTSDELLEIARRRLAKGHLAVVANRGEETGPKGEQVAYIVSNGEAEGPLVGKRNIAIGIADFLEAKL